MSHANAALTPRQRLRVARLIIDQGGRFPGLPSSSIVPGPRPGAGLIGTLRWAKREWWKDSSSRHGVVNRTPHYLVRKVVHLR
jgi:hypothetical protein